ncbi:hypothetical protein [Natronomonas marina]|jgi:uncharacterized Zn finger protein (UPF0148 family)|uniref:hypothetical protein n=1 Tax=Natronomonas marina TaxID=2961939 RepID=UPI0020CA2167|nr:hypothetical protein [Natronomonas marina]
MASSPGERLRTVCEACGLPFYAEKAACPYCGSAAPGEAAPEESGFVFGNDADGNGRTRCPECGLPHYDDTAGCPYCEYAGTTGESESTADTPAERPTDGTTESESGIFDRLKSVLGL